MDEDVDTINDDADTDVAVEPGALQDDADLDRDVDTVKDPGGSSATPNPPIEKVAREAALLGQAAVRDNFSRLPADLLIINDQVFDNIPATAVSIQSEADVFVAETLRSQTATIEPKGRTNGLVSIQLVFNDRELEMLKLRRLMAELLHNPFVFIENNKIRQTLHAPTREDVENGITINTETMAFVLHFGSLSVGEQMPGVITVDLQFAEFNYKPFSHHFWYGTKIDGQTVETVSGVTTQKKTTVKTAKIRSPKIFPYDLVGYESYELSEKAIRSTAAEAMNSMLDKINLWGSINSPAIFPAQSPAYLYYAQHMEDNMPQLGRYNSDYIRFMYSEFDVKIPPDGAGSGSSTLADYFSEQDYTGTQRSTVKKGAGKSSGGKKLDLTKRVNPKRTMWGTPGNSLELITRMEALLTLCGVDNPRLRVFINAISGEASGWKKQKVWHYNAFGVQGGTCKNGEFFGKWSGNWYTMKSREKDKKTGLYYPTPGQPWRAFGSWKEAIDDEVKRITSSTYASANKMLQDPNIPLKDALFELMKKYATAGKPVEYWEKMVGTVERILKKAAAQEAEALKKGIKGPLTKAKEWAQTETNTPKSPMEAYTEQAEKEKKQEKDQANNDQKSGAVPAAATGNSADEVKRKEMEEYRSAKREEWIIQQADEGWLYYGGEGKFKNLFYHNVFIDIGGDPTTTGSLPGIAPTAATIQFGHRLAKHKILGQDAPTWQFLGAGNKSGMIVFTAAGEDGRLALQKIRTMYATLNYNARNIDLVRGSSSVVVEPFVPNAPETNNIFLLAKIQNIVVTNISDESVIQNGVDVYKMTIEFMAQDFPDSSFTPRNFIRTETKNAIMAKLLRDLQAVDKPRAPGVYARDLSSKAKEAWQRLKITWQHTHFIQIFSMSVGAIVADAKREEYLNTLVSYAAELESAGNRHIIRPSNKICTWSNAEGKYVATGNTPQWYVDLLFSLSSKIKYMSSQFPILSLPAFSADYLSHTGSFAEQEALLEQEAKSSDTWEEKLRKFGDNLGGVGNNLVQLVGGEGIPLAVNGRKIKGFVVPDDVVGGNRIQQHLLDQLGIDMNSFLQRALGYMKDKAGFTSVFTQGVYDEILASVLSDFGECYKDLNLPPSPSKKGVPLTPEFYMYDDSLENASLTQLTTGTGALVEAIKRHVRNQAKSNAKFLSDRVLGRLQVSKNVGQLVKINSSYNNIFDDEAEFLGKTGGFAGLSLGTDGSDDADGTFKAGLIEEALRSFDATGYLLEEDAQMKDQGDKNLMTMFLPAKNEWAKFQKYGVAASNNMTQAFLTAVVTTSNLSCFNDSMAASEKGNLYRNLREFYFNEPDGTAPTRILRGPSVLNTNVDDNWGGKITLESVADLGEELAKESANNLAGPNQAPEAQMIQGDGCVSLSQAEADSIKDQQMMDEDLAVKPEQKNTPSDDDYKFMDTFRELTGLRGAQHDVAVATDTLGTTGKAVIGFLNEQEALSAVHNKEKATLLEPKGTSQMKKHLGKLYDMWKDTSSLDKTANALLVNTTRKIKKDISLRRAYPTFKIYFIDQDSETEGMSGYRAFDDFYSYNAVQEIRISRSRKIAADMAVIRITDVARKLTMSRFSDVEMDEEDLGKEDALGWAAETLKENPFNGGILQEGVKVQIRLGYSNVPDELETVFLGQITEIAPSADGKILEIACQGYGAELEAASMDNPEEEVIYYSPQHALSAAIMQPFIQNFGHWSFNEFYNPAQIRNRYDPGGESPFEFTFLQDQVRADTYRLLRWKNFRNNPEDDNIFAPPPWTYASSWDTFWNNAVAFRPLMMTPWETFKEHELRHPGYVAMALPYGHEPRMTMFFGARGQNYWCKPPTSTEVSLSRYWTQMVERYGGRHIENVYSDDVYQKGLKELMVKNPDFFVAYIRSLLPGGTNTVGFYLGTTFGRYRPFRNYHIFTSEHHIIQNDIRSSMANTFNAVEIRYADDEDVLNGDDPEEIMNDINGIQKGGGGILTVQLNDNIPEYQVRTYEDAFPSCVTKMMARRYAQALLMQGVKESYVGSLTITGEETLKPYDIVMVRDHITDMYGPIEVEAVTHIFNRETGFISVITPNMCVDANDWYAKGWMDTTIHVLSLVYDVAERQKTMNTFRQNPLSVGGSYDNFLAKMASFQIIHWDQTASPMCITPLMHCGRPLVSVTTAAKFASLFTNIWGKWHQWWEDFRVGMALGGVSEELALWQDDLANSAADLVDSSPGGSRKEKGGER